MALKLNRHANLIGHIHPLPDHGDHPVNAKWHHLTNHIHKRAAKILRHHQRLTQTFNGLGKCNNQRHEAMTLHMRAHLMGLRHITGPEVNRHPIIARVGHHFADLVIGQLYACLVMGLHRPKASIGFEALRHTIILRQIY